MRSGQQTLRDIDNAISQARETLDRTTRLSAQLSEDRAAIERQRLDAIRVIASERIGLLSSGEADDVRDRDIQRADRQAEELLENHAREMAALLNGSQQAKSELERLEGERETLEDEVNAAIEAFDKAAAATQAKLGKNAAYKKQLAQVEEAEAVVDRAEQKLALAQADETRKGEPYRQDPLFFYLWKRHYGTKDYDGGLITKMLDDWVARLCDYRDAALNYKRLTEIPKRLAAHVDGLEEQAEAERRALKVLENEALERDGAAALREASTEAQARLDALDAQIAEAEAHYRDRIDAQTAATGKNSDAYNQALGVLSEALRYEDIPDLRLLASQTRSLDDDDAIARLIRLEDEAEDLERNEEDAGALIEKYRRSLEDLEDVRQRFKNARYDAPTSEFPMGDLIGSMLGEILAGALTSNDIWDQLQRGQRSVRRGSDFDFGGGDWTEGFRIPSSRGGGGRSGGSRGGGMTRPSRMPRQRSGRSPSSGKGRGGGFRTGGGF
ncbi:MAG TPA: hypothetical protein VKN63_05820 [Afifellaceae bacterium]|nr:hypothetical protein [Afifellaceae bacterium]